MERFNAKGQRSTGTNEIAIYVFANAGYRAKSLKNCGEVISYEADLHLLTHFGFRFKGFPTGLA